MQSTIEELNIKLTNVTVDSALRLMSALEFSGLLRDTKLEMGPKDAVAVASEYLHQIQTEKPSQIETVPQDAGDCDLFIDDLQDVGFHLQNALDAWVQGRDTAPKKLPAPLPRLGSPLRDNRVTISEAQRMLGWGRNTIYNFIYTGTVDFFTNKAGHCELTYEQVAILALARKIQEATGQSRLGRKVIRQATRAFMTAFPRHVRPYTDRAVA